MRENQILSYSANQRVSAMHALAGITQMGNRVFSLAVVGRATVCLYPISTPAVEEASNDVGTSVTCTTCQGTFIIANG